MSATQTAPAKPGSGMPTPGDHVIVLFGATGDLARRKLLPGLYHLDRAGLLPAGYRIVGTSPRPLSDQAFRAHARAAVVQFGRGELDPGAWDAFAAGLSYAPSDAADASALADAVDRAKEQIGGSPRLLHYLSVPPAAVAGIAEALGASGDRTLFTRADGIERLWEVATPLLERPPAVERYAPGSWGPASVNQLIAPRRWHLPEDGR